MKNIRESIGLMAVAMFIVVLMGLAGWNVFAGWKAVEQGVEKPQKPAIEESVQKPPAADSSAGQLKDLQRRLEQIEQEQKMTETAAKHASSSVALIVGEYIWTDPSGRRPLRYQGADASGKEIAGFGGDGSVITRDFTGTGFLLSSGQVLTSGFVLSPWAEDPLLDQSDQPERIPAIRSLHAYFPGRATAVDLKIAHAQENADTVLCTVEHGGFSGSGLQLSKTPVQTGEALVSIGYPGGVPLLAARLPDDMKRELVKFGTDNTDALAMARRPWTVQPVNRAARVSVQTGGKIFYEMLNSLGNTGGPLNMEGKVAAMNHRSIRMSHRSTWRCPSFRSWLADVTTGRAFPAIDCLSGSGSSISAPGAR
jgi:hypothetical protein